MTCMYGSDPYNSADAPELGQRVVRNHRGPLGEAYRFQQYWDFSREALPWNPNAQSYYNRAIPVH